MVASTASGAPTIRTALVTERDNAHSPLWSSFADFRGSAADQPTFQAPRNPPAGLSGNRQERYQAEAATKNRSWPSSWPGRMAIIAR